MADDAMIRRDNLRRLTTKPNELVERCGKTYSYWRDMLSDPKKSFGEKIARHIEDCWKLPRLWMDQVHDAREPLPEYPSPALEGLEGKMLIHAVTVGIHIQWEDLKSMHSLPESFSTHMPDESLAGHGPGHIPKGEQLVFFVGIEPRPGRPVLVKTSKGDWHIRNYAHVREDHWRATASNDSYMSLDSEMDGLTLLAVMKWREG